MARGNNKVRAWLYGLRLTNLIALLLWLAFGWTPLAGGNLTDHSQTAVRVTPNAISGRSPKAGARYNFPVMFMENVGQFAKTARFKVHGSNHTIWLTDDAIWVSAVDRRNVGPIKQFEKERVTAQSVNLQSKTEEPQRVSIRLTFAGASPQAQLEPFNRIGTEVSYFIGKSSTEWLTDLPAWGGVRYANLYPGVDLEVTGDTGQIMFHLVCRSNCQTTMQNMRMRVEGANAIALDDEDLHLTTDIGSLSLPLLRSATTEGDPLDLTDVQPAIEGNDIIAPFTSPNSRPRFLQDNPNDLLYSSYLGGSSFEVGKSIAADAIGNAYMTGISESSDFPTTPGVFDVDHNGGYDVFVAKLNPDGTDLLYATFLGGSSRDDGNDLAVDGAGCAYVTGFTESANFPTTPGAFDTTYNGNSDVFAVKLSEDGSNLIYSTFLGGSGDDIAGGIAIDVAGNTYLGGLTTSANFPTATGSFDPTYNGGLDAFAAKLNATGTGLVYGTFLGGSDSDRGLDLTIDNVGNVYLTGDTAGVGFPTTPGSFSPVYNGGFSDAFIAKVTTDGTNLVYATYLGGSDHEEGRAISVDRAGNAYLTGHTRSDDFPTTPDAFDTTLGVDALDAYAVKVNGDGSDLTYGTYLGGSYADWGWAIDVDSIGHAYVLSVVGSPDFPTTPGAFDTSFNGGGLDCSLVKVNIDGTDLAYGTYLGGSDWDGGCHSVTVDQAGHAYVTGNTLSADFPTTPGAFDTSYNGNWDAFVAKLQGVGSTGDTARVYLPLIIKDE